MQFSYSHGMFLASIIATVLLKLLLIVTKLVHSEIVCNSYGLLYKKVI